MSIEVVPFEPSDEHAARQAWEISRAAAGHEAPDLPFIPVEPFVASIRKPEPHFAWARALGRLDGAPAGYAELTMPLRDNLENSTLQVEVRPAARRHGVGRALQAWAAEQALASGRRRMTGETVQRLPDGDAFAAALGAIPALPETRSRLDVTALDQERLDTMLAEAWKHAEDYRLVVWEGVPAPAHIDDVARLDSSFMAEAPLGDLEWEPEEVDADRIRSAEQSRLDRGFDRLHAGAVHAASGRMVAWTTLAGHQGNPQHLWQNITLVDPAHRGHRLGLIIKLENLRNARAQRPGLTAIDTFNASSNEHMLSINRTMGFAPVDSWMEWQLTL